MARKLSHRTQVSGSKYLFGLFWEFSHLGISSSVRNNNQGTKDKHEIKRDLTNSFIVVTLISFIFYFFG